MFSSWIFYVIIFIIAQIIFLQTFKHIAKDSKSIGALTVLVQIISTITSAVFILLLLPLSGSIAGFGWQWPDGSIQWLLPWVVFGIAAVLLAVLLTPYFKNTWFGRKKWLPWILYGVVFVLCAILLAPYFRNTWSGGSSAWLPWALLGISFILFAVNDRLDATTRKNMDISVDTMLHQVYRLLFFPALILVATFGPPFRWVSLIAGIVIVVMNMLLIFKKGKFKHNKYVWIKLLSVLFFTGALTLQLISINEGDFNLPFFAVLSFGIPALLLAGVKQATPFTVIKEFRRKEWWMILICGVAQAIFCICLYVSMALPPTDRMNFNAISAVYVLLNVVFAFIFLKERSSLVKKIIIAIMIVACVIIIALSRDAEPYLHIFIPLMVIPALIIIISFVAHAKSTKNKATQQPDTLPKTD